MSKNVAFCCLTVTVYLMALLEAALPADCAEGDLFQRWGVDQAVPVPALDAGRWYRAALGWVVAPDDCAARQVAEEMEAASRAFERHFGVVAPAGAVIDVAHARHGAALKEAGAAWVLPWRFSETAAPTDARGEAIRNQIRAQLASDGREPDPERVEVLVQQTLARLGEPQAPKAPSLEPKAIRHEIAHLLFMHSIWPSTEENRQYGGDAPDWLDEAAAVVAEGQRMTAVRREAFRALARNGRAIPMTRYLRMTHPVFGGAAFQERIAQAERQAESSGAAVASFSVPESDLGEASAFYAQTRGLIDYLIDRSGDERILATITNALKGGQSLEQWLAEHGSEHGLPASIKGVEHGLLASVGAE
ncbi:MAG: hypothetical protein U5L08_10225 [Xanthomonadales bacterium]|nr:hypothetical protein [Xanthomonadales bacterium]